MLYELGRFNAHSEFVLIKSQRSETLYVALRVGVRIKELLIALFVRRCIRSIIFECATLLVLIVKWDIYIGTMAS